MKKTTLTDRGVQKTIRRLEADGWLEIDTGNGRHGCNNYTIKNPEPRSPRTTFPPNVSAETPNVSAENPEPRSPEPSRTIIEPSYFSPPVREREVAGTQGDFEEFWRAYPNRVQRPSAQGAYQFACIKAAPAIILAGAIRYSQKQDDRPWMNPAKWLAEECWNDEPAAPIPKQNRQPASRETKTESAIRKFMERGHDDEQPHKGDGLRNVFSFPALRGT